MVTISNNCDAGTNRVAYYDLRRKTIRCDDCALMISGENTKRCKSCEKYRQTLNRMVITHNKGKDPDKTDWQSHTNNRFLTPSEKIQRMMALYSQARTAKQHISHVHDCIGILIDQRSVKLMMILVDILKA